MNREQQYRKIRAAMVLRGIKGSDIARKLKITRQSVCQVTAGRQTNKRVTAALIEAGVPAKLFEEKGKQGKSGRLGQKKKGIGRPQKNPGNSPKK